MKTPTRDDIQRCSDYVENLAEHFDDPYQFVMLVSERLSSRAEFLKLTKPGATVEGKDT